MARARAEVPPSNVTFTMNLTAEEAKAFKGMMQNPANADEDRQVRILREVIWKALDVAGVTL